MTTSQPNPQPSFQPGASRPPLFTQRAALLLLVAVFLGSVIGVLTYAAAPVLAAAAVAGLLAAGSVLFAGHQLLE